MNIKMSKNNVIDQSIFHPDFYAILFSIETILVLKKTKSFWFIHKLMKYMFCFVLVRFTNEPWFLLYTFMSTMYRKHEGRFWVTRLNFILSYLSMFICTLCRFPWLYVCIIHLAFVCVCIVFHLVRDLHTNREVKSSKSNYMDSRSCE